MGHTVVLSYCKRFNTGNKDSALCLLLSAAVPGNTFSSNPVHVSMGLGNMKPTLRANRNISGHIVSSNLMQCERSLRVREREGQRREVSFHGVKRREKKEQHFEERKVA